MSGNINIKNENIQVFVRCRPLSAFEKKHNSFSIVEAIPDQKEVVVREKVTDRFSTKSFVFDKVFGPSCSQVEVHKSVAVPLIKEVLMGYNCTIFAYGQTGTGKTFTMEGERSNKHYTWEDDPMAGLIPRTLQQIFEELESQELEFRIRVSYLELYNEELFDLLGPNEEPPKLRIFEDSSRKGSVLIQGLEEVSLRSKNEIYNILDKGSVRRRKAFTLLNASSSRSHAIFSITVQIKENCPNGEELLKIGKLHLVDLAGSESIGRSGAVDKRAREAGNINQSLLTLGRVITALYERASHIPYRESKLTRLLQDSLGGRTKTSIVATISPAYCNVEETLNTLDYAFRAKNITNKPEVNEKLTKKALVKEYTEEIKRLRRDLETVQKKNGIFVDEENYAYMQEELSSKTSVIKKTLTEIESLKAQIEKINELFCTSKDDLQKAAIELTVQKQKNEKKSQKLKRKTEKLDHTHKVLKKLSYQNDEQKHLIYKHMETEETLSAQAKKLQETASETISDVQELHKKLERKHIIETQNDQRSNDFRTNMQYNLGQMEDSISVMWQQHSEFINTLQSNIGSGIELFHKQMNGLSHVMSTIVSSHTDLLETLSSQLNNQGKSEQRWAGEVIKTVAQNKETATSSHRTFLSEQFIPLMNIIQMLMQGQVAALQDCGKTLMSKIDQQEASVKFHLSEQKDLITNLWRNIELLSTEQRTGLEVCQQHVNRRVQFESELYKEREEQISIIQKAVSSLKQSLERHGNQVNQETPLLQKQLDDVAQLAQTTRSEIESGTKTLFAMTEEFEKVYTADAKELAVTSDENLCKVKGVIDDIKAKHDTLKTEIIEFGHQSEQLSEQNYRNLEALIRQHAETEIQDLQDNQYCMQELVSVARFGAEQHESVLEQHKLEFEAHVAAQKSVLGNMKDTSSAWVQEFSSNIWRRDKEMEKFLIEELQSDEPTGQTPDKKEYIYSREMAQTSPHDRILQRLRAVVNPSDELPPVPDSPLLGANERSFKIPEDRIDHLQPVPTVKLSDDSFVDSKDNEENKENSHHTPSKSTVTTSSASHPLRVNNA